MAQQQHRDQAQLLPHQTDNDQEQLRRSGAGSGASSGGVAGAAVNEARQRLANSLAKYALPDNLKNRLVQDVDGHGHYMRMKNIQGLDMRAANSSYCKNCMSGFWCAQSTLVQDGFVGLIEDNGDFGFLAPGYHAYCCCGVSIKKPISTKETDDLTINGPTGFITISEGKIGVLQLHGDFRLLAPGTYQWFSPSVVYVGTVDITVRKARLGPYTLVTVPDGEVAVTFNNGDLICLGAQSKGASRTFFLDDPKWVLVGFVSLKVQTDRLEGNDLLSKDNVELLMVAMSQWRIVDAYLSITKCSDNMEGIREKVNQLVRAAIARIVAGTCIGAGPVSGSVTRPVVVAAVASSSPHGEAAHSGAGMDDADLAHLMQSDQAQKHMAELTASMTEMGIEVIGVFVPEKRMKNDDIRREVATQAVIGIKAEADRSSADAKAYATVASARAEAQAILEVAKAHAEAGNLLGPAETTAARLALTERTAEALSDANVTIFSGSPGNMPFMLNANQTMK